VGDSRPAPAAAAGRPRRRALPRWLLGLIAAGAALVVLAVAWRALVPPAPPVASSPPDAQIVARGQVRPVGQARVGTLAGGTVTRLVVRVGDRVEEEQEIARVRGPNGTEVLTAPWRGTITTVPVHHGDTVLPGAIVATVGDLSRLQVETTDVDEFVIARVRPGQLLALTVDALDGQELLARVHSVALELEHDRNGDEHYPIVLDLVDPPPDLRPGMTVRLHWPD
jgi:HlyD family secretion protein